MIFPALMRRTVWAWNLYPQKQTELIRKIVDARINSCDVYSYEITTKILEGLHVPAHFFISRSTWLIQNSVKVNRLVIEVDIFSAGFNFSQAEMCLNGSGVSIDINKIRSEPIEVGLFRRPEVRSG